jgi:hypothetical protein
MTMADHSDPFDIVSGDPAAYFETPQAIADDSSLSRAEKLQLLDEWAKDIADRSSAADEGMIPDVPGRIDRDVALASQIFAVREAVEATQEAGLIPAAVRLWKRLTGATAEA